jgi:UDP-glucuronate 4-epimerase
MALFKFVKAVIEGGDVELYNKGDMIRDFTYVDDIVEGVLALDRARQADGLPAYDIFNIGCARPRELMEFVREIEKAVGKKARLKPLGFQPGDLHKTFADVSKLKRLCGYEPKTQIETGIAEFVKWYRDYFTAPSGTGAGT